MHVVLLRYSFAGSRGSMKACCAQLPAIIRARTTSTGTTNTTTVASTFTQARPETTVQKASSPARRAWGTRAVEHQAPRVKDAQAPAQPVGEGQPPVEAPGHVQVQRGGKDQARAQDDTPQRQIPPIVEHATPPQQNVARSIYHAQRTTRQGRPSAATAATYPFLTSSSWTSKPAATSASPRSGKTRPLPRALTSASYRVQNRKNARTPSRATARATASRSARPRSSSVTASRSKPGRIRSTSTPRRRGRDTATRIRSPACETLKDSTGSARTGFPSGPSTISRARGSRPSSRPRQRRSSVRPATYRARACAPRMLRAIRCSAPVRVGGSPAARRRETCHTQTSSSKGSSDRSCSRLHMARCPEPGEGRSDRFPRRSERGVQLLPRLTVVHEPVERRVGDHGRIERQRQPEPPGSGGHPGHRGRDRPDRLPPAGVRQRRLATLSDRQVVAAQDVPLPWASLLERSDDARRDVFHVRDARAAVADEHDPTPGEVAEVGGRHQRRDFAR